MGWFVLDNSSNNDTVLVKLAKTLPLDPNKKRLCCRGHMINLVVEAFPYDKYPLQLTQDFQKAKDDQTKLDL